MKKTILIASLSVFLAAIFLSCKAESKKSKINYSSADLITIEVKDSAIDISADTTQTWHNENENIIVLFGYGFNNATFVFDAKSMLDKNFGLSENGGKIVPVVFPDDFKHKEKSVSTDFFNIINNDELNVKGIILLGAPNNTHKALAKMQDLWDGEIPYPVFTLFPQDDVLGIEDTSDIVIDRLQKAELDTNLAEESEQVDTSDALDILLRTTQYLIATDTGPAKDDSIALHAKQMLPNKTVKHYTDSETGLNALNHFVIE